MWWDEWMKCGVRWPSISQRMECNSERGWKRHKRTWTLARLIVALIEWRLALLHKNNNTEWVDVKAAHVLESLSRTAVGTRMIFGSLDRFQDASAFSTSVLAFCLPRKPRQSSLSLTVWVMWCKPRELVYTRRSTSCQHIIFRLIFYLIIIAI